MGEGPCYPHEETRAIMKTDAVAKTHGGMPSQIL